MNNDHLDKKNPNTGSEYDEMVRKGIIRRRIWPSLGEFLDSVDPSVREHPGLRIQNNIQSLEGIEGFHDLELIIINPGCHDGLDFSLLANPKLQRSVRSVEVYGSVTNLDFLRDYKRLVKLVVHGNDQPKEPSYLHNMDALAQSEIIADTLRYLELQHLKLFNEELFPMATAVDLSFLGNLRALEIFKSVYTDFVSLDPLGSEGIQKTLKRIFLHYEAKTLMSRTSLAQIEAMQEAGRIPFELPSAEKYGMQHAFDASNLAGFSALEDLHLEVPTENVGALAQSPLSRVVRKLVLKSKFIDDLGFLESFQRVSSLDLGETRLRDIFEILHYPFVINGDLTELTIPDSIHWDRVVGNRYINTEAVQELRSRGIDVHISGRPPELPKPEPQPKLYVVCGPSGSGKTTLIEYMKTILGIKPLRKTTTRPYRTLLEEVSQGVLSLPRSDFEERLTSNSIQGVHSYSGNQYGVINEDLLGARLSNEVYMLDSCDPESALRLRDANPDFVEVILLLPFAYLVERGLLSRERVLESQLANPDPGFETFEEQLRYLQSVRSNLVNTGQRISKIAEDFRRVEGYIPKVDHCIQGLDYRSNQQKVTEIVTRLPIQ
ncbi:hypothetical protein HOD38_03650 [archaeon]|jgi:guanylate kinase|nr:hypothetical protein [archaeon]MBT4397335.1 hypothetical protein [archaeon]MBT4440715.1 hypothetical protein [archaeon]